MDAWVLVAAKPNSDDIRRETVSVQQLRSTDSDTSYKQATISAIHSASIARKTVHITTSKKGKERVA